MLVEMYHFGNEMRTERDGNFVRTENHANAKSGVARRDERVFLAKIFV